jgi:hypothetical protein
MSFFARKKYINTSLQGGYVELRVFQVKDLPIISSLPIDQIQFIKKADSIINLNKEYHSINLKFLKLLRSDFQQLKTSKKIENWQILTWDEFESELKKLKTPLFGIIKDDWFDRFERFKKQAIDLKSQIDQTDAAIDRMVYELYGLTEEEIQIVENS